MKKFLVLGIVIVMLMSMAVAASAFTKDTDWLVCLQAGNDTWNTTQQNWGSAGADIKLGNATTPGTTAGSAMSSTTTAYVRDMSSRAYGLTTNTKAALDQTDAVQTQVWNNIVLFVGGSYSATTCSLRLWGTGIDADGPRLKLEVVSAMAGSGFNANEVVFDNTLVNGTKHFPATTINLMPYINVLKTGTAANPAVTFRLTATTPAIEQPVPEPGSMLAMFSGLVGLVGYGIRRRK